MEVSAAYSGEETRIQRKRRLQRESARRRRIKNREKAELLELRRIERVALRERGFLTDVEMQEPSVTQNITSKDQTSDVIGDSVHRSTEDIDTVKISSTESENEHVLSPKKHKEDLANGHTYSRSCRRIIPTEKVADRPEKYSRFFRKIKTESGSNVSDTAITTLNSDEKAVPNCPTSVSSANSSKKMPLPSPTRLFYIAMPETILKPVTTGTYSAVNTVTTSTSSPSVVELTQSSAGTQPVQVSGNKPQYLRLVTLPTTSTTTTTALSTSVPTVTNTVSLTSTSQILPTVSTVLAKLQMDKRKLVHEKSLVSNDVQGQSASVLNEQSLKHLEAFVTKDSKRKNSNIVLVMPSKQNTKKVIRTSAEYKVSQNTNPLQVPSVPPSVNTKLESSNSFKDSSSIVVSQHNLSDIKNTYSRIKEKNTLLKSRNAAKEGSTSLAISHDSSTQPLFSSSGFVKNLEPVSEAKKENAALKQVSITGRRIIEFDYFLKMLKLVNKHSKTSSCNLNDIIITREMKVGLKSFYSLKCVVCGYKITLGSENPSTEKNINLDAIEGMCNTNSNLDDMNKLLWHMKLPYIRQDIFIREYKKTEERSNPTENFSTIPSMCSKNSGESLEHRPQEVAVQGSEFCEKPYSKTAQNSPQKTIQKSKSVDDFMSDSADKSFEQVHLDRILMQDQFEIEKKNDTVLDNMPVDGGDHILLNATQIKQEMDLDIYQEEFAEPETKEVVLPNNDNLVYGDQSKRKSSHQKQIEACDNEVVVDKDNIQFHKTLIKQEIQDDNNLLKPDDIETAYKECVSEFDQMISELFLKKS